MTSFINTVKNSHIFSKQVVTSLRGNSKKEVDIIAHDQDEFPKGRFLHKIPARRMASHHSNKLNNARRKVEDKMAKMFMWIVAIFMTCHLPR